MENFNKTYLIKTSKKQTVRMIDFIYKSLLKKLNHSFKLINVSPPLFSKLGDSSILSFKSITRPINIDLIDEYQVVTLYQSLSRWAQKAIIDYGILINEGILYKENSIWRDLLPNPNASQHKLYLCIELNVGKYSNKIEKLLELTNIIYKHIYEISNEINDKYNIDNIYPKIIEFVESQLLDNEFHNLNSYDKEMEIAQELKAFVLMEPGKKLLSGNVHSQRSNQIYNENLYNEIHLLNNIDGSSINVASISYKLWGDELSSQLDNNLSQDQQEEKLLNKLINDKSTQTIEIRVNLFKLYLVLLKKGHIAEVQPNVIHKKINILRKKHMIETL